MTDTVTCPDEGVQRIAPGALAPAAWQKSNITRVELDAAGKVTVHVRSADGSTGVATYRVKARREETFY
jgi:hypothetical protein